MARQRISLAIVSLLLMILTLNLGENSEAETLQNFQTWCVAKPSVSESLLNQNIEYACGHMDVKDCNPIKEGSGSPCYEPNTIIQHASYAMNAFYQKSGRHQWDCNFGNSGLISLSDPSYGGCIYEGGQVQIDPSTSGMWCVASPSASIETLQNNIDYACNRIDCSVISGGGVCYDPNNVFSHASVAMNLYFQANGRSRSGCDFRGTGLIVTTDPSYGKCIYKYL